MKTRTSPRNQEILWKQLGGNKPASPRRLPISKIKPVFDWEQNRYVDPTDASYLERLGTSSAAKYAPIIKKQASENGISLPLPDHDVEILLDNTIEGLAKEKKIAWKHTSTDRKLVFTMSWASEMVKQGIRA